MTVPQKINQMVEFLPSQEQQLVYEFVKRMVLAWDPDFTRLTPAEYLDLELAEQEINNGEYVDAKDIDWDNL